MKYNISPINAFNDNYIWCMSENRTKNAIAVDPGQAAPLIDYLARHQLHLSALLITHHHDDHTAGIGELKQRFSNLLIYGPDNSSIRGITHPVASDQRIDIPSLQLSFNVIATPGHTLDHICYYLPSEQVLFCGDTLFAGGCGRLFEGTALQMHQSLHQLAELPGHTKVYCAHEYTLENYRFAECVEPFNQDLQAAIQSAQQRRNASQPSLPSTVEQENKTNPFLRCGLTTVQDAIKAHFGKEPEDEVAAFAMVRKWKDRF